MAINFPTSLDSLSNPSATDKVSTGHASQHANANDILEALEAKVGIDSSAVTTSHDYKLGEVTGTDKAVGKTATQTLTSKTLTTPKIGTSILDTNAKELIKFTPTADAVNEIQITNAITATDPLIDPSGDDTNIGIKIKGKGTGKVKLGDAEMQFPDTDGSNTHVLTTNGAGVMSFAAQATAPTCTTCIPKPAGFLDPTAAAFATSKQYNSNTTMRVGLINFPQQITAAKISFYVGTKTANGTLNIVLFTEDGQTKTIDHTTASITSTGLKIETLAAPVVISPGNYYLAVLSISTCDVALYNFPTPDITTFGASVTGEAIYEGYKTVTADTIPATIDPTADITYQTVDTTIVRFDA